MGLLDKIKMNFSPLDEDLVAESIAKKVRVKVNGRRVVKYICPKGTVKKSRGKKKVPKCVIPSAKKRASIRKRMRKLARVLKGKARK